jgi:hypothetical protein
MARSAIHPGENRHGRRCVAREIDPPAERMTGIVEGQQDVTADTALRLGDWFGTSPEFGSICNRCTNCGGRVWVRKLMMLGQTLATGGGERGSRPKSVRT